MVGPGVLDRVGQGLGEHEVGRGFHRGRRPTQTAHVQRAGDRGAAGQRGGRPAEPQLVEHRRVDVVHGGPQVAQRLGGRGLGAFELRQGGGRVLVEGAVRHPEHHHHTHQAVLRSVVQLALDPAQLGGVGVQGGGAAGGQGLDPLAHHRGSTWSEQGELRRRHAPGEPGNQQPAGHPVQEEDPDCRQRGEPAGDLEVERDGWLLRCAPPLHRGGQIAQRTEHQTHDDERQEQHHCRVQGQPEQQPSGLGAGEQRGQPFDGDLARLLGEPLRHRHPGVAAGPGSGRRGTAAGQLDQARGGQPADAQGQQRRQQDDPRQQQQRQRGVAPLNHEVNQAAAPAPPSGLRGEQHASILPGWARPDGRAGSTPKTPSGSIVAGRVNS